MFIGHIAVGFASKRLVPRASLGALMAAPMALDLLWPWFLLAGWEQVRIDPGNTAFTPLDFVSYPYSHSLAMSMVWAVLFAGIYWAVTRYAAGAWVIAAGVVSHWILDFVTHRPDLPLYPGGTARLGLGLWNSVVGTIAVESAMFAAAVWIYTSSTRARDRAGIYGFWIFVALIALSYFANAFGSPPPSAEFLARFSVGIWLIPLWAWWFAGIGRPARLRHEKMVSSISLMRWTNRAKVLWSFLRGAERVPGLPVEYIVETTAKCNLYCPMCPREIHKQPKEDMSDQIFERLVEGAAETGEHMMLIGLGEPFMDRKIFDRIEFCEKHGVATLLSTNGTFLDEALAERLLDSRLRHITLSFDGASKETFEHYRKGAKFERVRDNFVRFCRMKHARGSKLQIVVQMVRMPGNAHEAGEFHRFWSGIEGVDQVRIKEDETNLVQPEKQSRATSIQRRCHYLWRGAMYVKHDGRVFPCCQSYSLDGAPVGDLREQSLEEIFNSGEMRRLRRAHTQGRAAEIDMCARCSTPIPHPLLVAASLLVHGKWVRRAMPAVERWIYGHKLPRTLLTPIRGELVQIQPPETANRNSAL